MQKTLPQRLKFQGFIGILVRRMSILDRLFL